MFRLFSVVEEVESEYNGTIQVVRDFSGVRILAGGVSQSGWLVKSVWNSALRKIKQYLPEAGDVLILGLGGGSVAGLVQNYWSKANVTGVDIDPVMVDLGRKYLGLGNVARLDVVIGDASRWVKKSAKDKCSFNLILVDLYEGGEMPKQFKTDKFIKDLVKICKKGGAITFNHLYSGGEREDAHAFEKALRGLFPTIIRVYPEANVVYVCFN